MKRLFKLWHWVLWNHLSRPFFVEPFLVPRYHYAGTPESQPFPRPPFLVIGNHGTFFDPWIIGSFSRYPFYFMTNDDGFRGNPVTRWYLRGIGAFPKRKGASDYRAMKTTVELIRGGNAVCIFPEGQTTWDGETQLIYAGIVKLIKRLACPLVTVHLQGNFLTKPWWAKTLRTGRILVTATVHTPESIRRQTEDELLSTVTRSIYQNDIKDPDNLAAPFSGVNLATGLERLVWICMQCGAEDTLSTSGDTVSCSACGCSWRIDAHCRLTALQPGTACCGDLKDWVELHKARVREAVAGQQEILTQSDGVVLQRENDRGRFIDGDRGRLTLTAAALRFRGAGSTVEWPLTEIEDYVIQKKDIVEFRRGTTYHRFAFCGKSPMKWIFYMRYCKGYEQCEKRGYL
ncbi:MAG: 1-acyl-sn-glycerol-3-phosphate acyltransferase [Chitinispirillaceae bacterium]|nr:1-acyl-sn-glycerol-3-phosphate acyltransferase [Chitinispirillaceae bacterium]